jgi:hypothetical protein
MAPKNPALKTYPHVRPFTNDELHEEVGEYFDNKVTKKAFPKAFASREALRERLQNAPLKVLSRAQLLSLNNSDVGDVLTDANPRARAQSLAKEYGRDYDRIANALKESVKLPSPIVIQHDKGLHLMGGNTRLMALAGEGHTLPVRILDIRAAGSQEDLEKSEASHYDKYDRRTNEKMAEHNREGGDVRKPVRSAEGASSQDKRDRARFAFRKATQALKQSHPLEDDNGKPTPAAMQFKRWGFAVPKTREDLQRLKAFGAKHMKAALEKAIRDIRLVPTREDRDFSTYDVHDSASKTPQTPTASVAVTRRKGAPKVAIEGEANTLGVRGLRAVAMMVGKLNPDIKHFSGSRPKAAERAAYNQDFPKTTPDMTQEQRLDTYDTVGAMIEDKRQEAKASMKARKIAPRQQVRRKNPFADGPLEKANGSSNPLQITQTHAVTHAESGDEFHEHEVRDHTGAMVGQLVVRLRGGKMSGFKSKGLKSQHMGPVLEHLKNTYEPPLEKAGVIVDPMPLRKLGKLFDYESLGKDVVQKPQGNIERVPITASGSAANYDMTVDQTSRRLKGRANQKRLDEGMAHHGHLWYHMDPLHNAFKERHGEEEGTKRFNLFMNTVAATSPNSEFTKNMKRAGALFPFMVHGDKKHVLSAEEGINHLLSQGKGGTGNTAHRNYATALQNIRDGKQFLFSKPLKADGFAENLKGNFGPLTADRHFLRQAGHFTSTAGPTDYQGVEDATAAHAANLATHGLLPVHPGRGATAPYQSALWIGDALHGRVKSPPHPALAVFEHEINQTAQQLNIHPKEALNRFLDGHLHEFGGGAPGLTALLKQDQMRKSLAALRSVLMEIPLMKGRYDDDFDPRDADYPPPPPEFADFTDLGDAEIAHVKSYRATPSNPRISHEFFVRGRTGPEAKLYVEHNPAEHKPGQYYAQISSPNGKARNQVGVAGMRQVASYLKQEHGVHSIVAGGSYKTGEHKDIERDITKSLEDVDALVKGNRENKALKNIFTQGVGSAEGPPEDEPLQSKTRADRVRAGRATLAAPKDELAEREQYATMAREAGGRRGNGPQFTRQSIAVHKEQETYNTTRYQLPLLDIRSKNKGSLLGKPKPRKTQASVDSGRGKRGVFEEGQKVGGRDGSRRTQQWGERRDILAERQAKVADGKMQDGIDRRISIDDHRSGLRGQAQMFMIDKKTLAKPVVKMPLSKALADLKTSIARIQAGQSTQPMSERDLLKAQFMQRLVQWIGGSKPSGTQGGEDGRMTTTMTRDGKVSRITSGAVKLSQVPKMKQGKLRREVTVHDAEDVKSAKDTDVAKYTPMSDGRVARIQFFVKSLLAFRKSMR